MEYSVQLDMSEGQKLNLQFISVAQQGISHCFHAQTTLNNRQHTMLCKISFLTLIQNQL